MFEDHEASTLDDERSAFLDDIEPQAEPQATIIPFRKTPSRLSPRHHVLTSMMQERSGRLYCADDWNIEIPDLEIYAAR